MSVIETGPLAVVDEAHRENYGGKHREGFCEACADAYIVAQHAIPTSQMVLDANETDMVAACLHRREAEEIDRWHAVKDRDDVSETDKKVAWAVRSRAEKLTMLFQEARDGNARVVILARG